MDHIPPYKSRKLIKDPTSITNLGKDKTMTFTTAGHRRRTARPSPLRGLPRLFAVWRQRRVLQHLDDRALEDIGITRAQAEAEARRRPWDAPETWRN